ncbi:glycosyltransferase family 9 protein [Paenarthrobacter sp. PH39-S1]|uniref:glycosyltransferase family 9 protein n=1 Tax=Paenarthrobacter sp. PH39-S1 TaxID=3046204 RepID=UPI0024BA9E29|nr:glycosyltransferase family 9 protein [Paenarthrobacter sp. PH39-S1]MDJ0355358.1 glycosyltransferase family 9 protein [Paenarthrobacter sp. PH39-S1]
MAVGRPNDFLRRSRVDSLPSDGRPEVLALRALKLGDLLVAVPALHALRRAYPGHRLIYAARAWLAPALALVGGVDTLLETQGLDEPLTLSPGRVDVAVNLHGSGPESLRRLDELAPARRIGHLGPGWEGPPWRSGLHERERWAALLRWHGIPADPLDYRLQPPTARNPLPGAAVIHVGAAYGSRLWPEDRFAAVARRLESAGQHVAFTGSEGERPRALRVAALAGLPDERVGAGMLGLGEFAAVIAGAAIVVSADTGAAHLASAYGRRSIVIFGPAPVSEWGPPPGPHIALTKEELRRGDVFSASPDPALLAVSVQDVLAAARELGSL